MSAFLAGLVTFFKGAQALRDLVNTFIGLWIEHDVKEIGDEADSRKQEHAVINAKFKESTSDVERRVLLRTLNRLR